MGKEKPKNQVEDTRAVVVGRKVSADAIQHVYESRPRYLQKKDKAVPSDLFKALQNMERFQEDWG